MSLPVWGEWIEIVMLGKNSLSLVSLPVWGEWIEIQNVKVPLPIGTASLPVWGEWIEMKKSPATCPIAPVSPRVGRVD